MEIITTCNDTLFGDWEKGQIFEVHRTFDEERDGYTFYVVRLEVDGQIEYCHIRDDECEIYQEENN